MLYSFFQLSISKNLISRIRPWSIRKCKGISVLTLQQKVETRTLVNVIQFRKKTFLDIIKTSSVLNVSVRQCTDFNEKSQTVLQKLVEKCPPDIKPYLNLARIERPTGTMLLLWPCFWSITLASENGHWPSFYHLALFGIGAFLMRGAGCTINDMWDKELDAKVDRTKNRPIASGVITQSDALAFLAFELGLASLVLLQLNWYCIILGASSLALVVTYPLAKRFTNWPQLILGLTFNWGALLGWASIHGSCDWTILLPLYVAGISWTLVYDTIYALQDKTDDASVGIKSTALFFGGSVKKWLSCFSCTMVGNLLLVGHLSAQTWPYYASVGIVSLHLAKQVITLGIENVEDCAKKFRSNNTLGLILCLGIIGGVLHKDNRTEKKCDTTNSQ